MLQAKTVLGGYQRAKGGDNVALEGDTMLPDLKVGE